MLHRITGMSTDGFRTRGDALIMDDGIAARDAVLGRATLIENRPSLHLHFPAGFLLVQALRLRRCPIIVRLIKILRTLASGLPVLRRPGQRQ
ncbi:MAG: hypothetical protein OHK006_21970 [Thermodesulfovibrionales bacterium]